MYWCIQMLFRVLLALALAGITVGRVIDVNVGDEVLKNLLIPNRIVCAVSCVYVRIHVCRYVRTFERTHMHYVYKYSIQYV